MKMALQNTVLICDSIWKLLAGYQAAYNIATFNVLAMMFNKQISI